MLGEPLRPESTTIMPKGPVRMPGGIEVWLHKPNPTTGEIDKIAAEKTERSAAALRSANIPPETALYLRREKAEVAATVTSACSDHRVAHDEVVRNQQDIGAAKKSLAEARVLVTVSPGRYQRVIKSEEATLQKLNAERGRAEKEVLATDHRLKPFNRAGH